MKLQLPESANSFDKQASNATANKHNNNNGSTTQANWRQLHKILLICVPHEALNSLTDLQHNESHRK